MKRKIIVVSHGNLAEAIVGVATLIMGKASNIEYLGLKENESRENFIARIEDHTQEDCEYIVLADLMSGTPFNAAYLAKKTKKSFHIIVGFNLPLIISLLNDMDIDLDDAIQTAVENGKQMIYRVEPEKNI